MAINIPSAAGFIPRESVLDGINQIMQLFGPEAKAKRAADLSLTQAQTGNLNATAGHTTAQTANMPAELAINQGQLGVAQQNAGTSAARIPIEQQQVNQQGSHFDLSDNVAADAQREVGREFDLRLGEQARQFSSEIGERKADREGRFTLGLGGLANDQARTGLLGAQIQQQQPLVEAQTKHYGDDAKQKEQLQALQETETMLKIMSAPGVNLSPAQQQSLIEHSISKFSPELGAQMRERFKAEMDALKASVERANSLRNQGGRTTSPAAREEKRQIDFDQRGRPGGPITAF